MTKTMNAAKACTAILLAIALTACATELGRHFDDAYARQIKPGETTKAEVVEKLGRPPMRRLTGDEETWTYAHYKGRGLGLGFLDTMGLSDEDLQRGGLGEQKRLVVIFKGDVVQSSKFTQELPVAYP
jgi:outer membrane protein assembly factor BamE (lipoprotein component of BamABCDE complex)